MDADDRAALSAQLGQTDVLDTYDLNGDGEVDVTDLSYVNKMMDLESDPRILSTTAIVASKVEGQTGDKPEFATVTQIEFLKDIVSE